ncbi:MAG: epoxyqueuosine reductase [Bacteroidia bacterium]|nr:epoxyqueuosine reductase [Bacteroidia bacterium]
MQKKIDSILLHHLVPATDFIYGFADLTGLLEKESGEFRYAISIGKLLDPRIVESITEGPTMEYFAHYRSMNADLSALSQSISEDLNALGIETRLVEPSVTTDQLDTIYEKTLRTPLSHKMAATRAGLGWIGKTDLFISNKFGPRLRLVTILTSTPLKATSRPINKSRCGTCNLCVYACPAGAANGKLWDITVDRDEFFDAFKCRRQCAEFGRTRLQMDARVCGICVAVCPIGK